MNMPFGLDLVPGGVKVNLDEPTGSEEEKVEEVEEDEEEEEAEEAEEKEKGEEAELLLLLMLLLLLLLLSTRSGEFTFLNPPRRAAFTRVPVAPTGRKPINKTHKTWSR